MLNDIFTSIEFIKKNATKSEKILINYLADCNFNDIIYLSITELADLVYVSEATILRFCRKLGFAGYQEFKLQLAIETAKSESGSNKEKSGDRIAENMVSAILSAKNILDYSQIDKAVDYLINSKNKFFFGVGNSALAALEARNRLIRAGIISGAPQDAHFQTMITANLTPDDVIVFISVSGSSIDLIETAKLAKQRGVKIIVITSYEKAPLSKYADVVIYSIKKEAPMEGGSLITKITQLYTLDVLCTAVYLKLGQVAKDNIEQSSKSVLNKLV